MSYWHDKLQWQLANHYLDAPDHLVEILRKRLQDGIPGRQDLYDVWRSVGGSVVIKSRLSRS